LGHLEPGLGIPVAKDTAAALMWHKRAGQAGNSEACYIVMTELLAGGVPSTDASTTAATTNVPDFKGALEWGLRCIEVAGGEAIMAVEQKDLLLAVLFRLGLVMMEGGNGIGDPDPLAGKKKKAKMFMLRRFTVT
jgi:TPR repeat protein